jgi:superoxide reductase
MAVQKINEVYKCLVCGNIVEAVHAGGGTLVCCGQEMILQEENTTDGAVEKHVPVVEREGSTVKVKIGEAPHPMEDSHYIEWIEIIADGISYKKFLKPGDAPEAEFVVPETAGEIVVREYCNLHGLWKK